MRTILILTLLSSCTIAMSQEPTLESGGTNGVTTGHITQPYAPYVFPCLTGLDTTAKLYEVSIEIEDHSGDYHSLTTLRKTPVIRVRGMTRTIVETDSGCFLVADSSIIKTACEDKP